MSLRELRSAGEKSIALESRGKEEVRGSVRISASFVDTGRRETRDAFLSLIFSKDSFFFFLFFKYVFLSLLSSFSSAAKSSSASLGASASELGISGLAADSLGMMAAHHAALRGDLAQLVRIRLFFFFVDFF